MAASSRTQEGCRTILLLSLGLDCGDVERTAATTEHVWAIGLVENRGEGERTWGEGDRFTPRTIRLAGRLGGHC